MSLMNLFSGRRRSSRAELRPSNLAFDVAQGQTVLESALKQGVDYPHDCTVGTCGSCRSRLLEGKVEAITPFSYTLSKEELAQGYILACQALAKSDLVLEVDVAPGGEAPPVRQPATLIAVEDLTHDIKRLTWRLPAPLNWRAGQYVNVRWNGGDQHRSYSLAIAPRSGGLTEVSTFARHVPGGAFTDAVFRGEPMAMSFEVDGPHGNFWLRDGAGPLLCVAGGSGLAPLLSLLQDAANRRVRRDCVLLFGARTRRDLYCETQIAEIRDAWPAAFDYWPVLSEEEAAGLRHGFVTAHVPAALQKLGPGAQVYMCGPPPMIDAAIPVAVDGGVVLGDIHYDKFTDASTARA